MKPFIKKYLSLLYQDFWLFAILALPGIAFYFFGLAQFDAFSWFTLTFGLLNKFIVEFCTILILFCILHVLGLKDRRVFALFFFLYYITITADIVLLSYFRERFGAKYLATLTGGQYAFMLDIRIALLLAGTYFFPYLTIRKFWTKRPSRHVSMKRIAAAAVVLLLLALISPMTLKSGADSFYASRLMNTTVAQIGADLINKKPAYTEYTEVPQELEAAVEEYNLFKPSDFKNENTYDRIILLTVEAFSDKFISSFNPAIPAAASDVFDGLIYANPFASLKPSALSTLYGLSVIFSGHPNAELMFNNDYPLSFVKILRDGGWRTAFIRGADEEYMNEHIYFKAAGFDEIYGAKYFERQPKYSNFVSWWGLTDRKLFEYAVDYLKLHRDEKVFLQLLTVDTHVPSGRADYLGQEYPPLEYDNESRQTKKIYGRTNMARAFSNLNYDLGEFLRNLQKEGLLDERTLVVVTGDHPFFANLDTGGLFKNYRPVFDEVPLIFIAEKPVLEPVANDIFKSQQDIAPTILGLAGLPAPRGMFGRSVFEDNPRTVFYTKNNYVIVSNTKGTKIVPVSSKKPEDVAVIKLISSVVK